MNQSFKGTYKMTSSCSHDYQGQGFRATNNSISKPPKSGDSKSFWTFLRMYEVSKELYSKNKPYN